MSTAILVLQPSQWRQALAANSTASAFGVQADTAVEPNAALVAGVIDIGAGSLAVPNAVLFKPYGVGADNTTGSIRVYGLRSQNGSVGPVWSYSLLFEGAFILSTAVGVAGGLVGATDHYADTITRTTGPDTLDDQLLSPANNVAGWLMVNTKGFSKLFVETTVGTATSVNTLWAAK